MPTLRRGRIPSTSFDGSLSRSQVGRYTRHFPFQKERNGEKEEGGKQRSLVLSARGVRLANHGEHHRREEGYTR